MNESKRSRIVRVLLPCGVALGGLILLLGGVAYFLRLRFSADLGPAREPRADSAGARGFRSPYKNTRLDVAYIGDAACAACHREIAETYRAHPMGRSLVPVTEMKDDPPAGGEAGLPVVDRGVRFTIESRGGRLIHKGARRDAEGHPYAEVEAEVKYALGSGTRGVSYLIEHDGFLLQSPLAWFSQTKRWDISPGYGESAKHPDFERAIPPDCLFCHANRFRPVHGTINRYETPIFQGHAIGCERCHGPGELHAKAAGPESLADFNIVNPGKLPPALRDSVCQQCHLQGSFRFERAGRAILDYRPGLPLHEFLAVFLSTQGDAAKFEAVGHVEQMEASRCFVASKGALGCISCHDPHRLPEASEAKAYYRGRCLDCHQKKGCALPQERRRSIGKEDDCAGCHMPRAEMTNVPHTAATDHRILRNPRAGARPARAAMAPRNRSLVRDFHWSVMTEGERREAGRDLGMALSLAARNTRTSPIFSKEAATQSLPLLQEALRARSNDWPARESLGQVLAILGRPEEALESFRQVLEREPSGETNLRSIGQILTRLKQPGEARLHLQKTIAINPWRSQYHLMLANVCGQLGDWPAAITACREALRLNPELTEARSMLVQCYLRSGQPAEAEAEFQVLLRFSPAGRVVWLDWYANEKKAAPSRPATASP